MKPRVLAVLALAALLVVPTAAQAKGATAATIDGGGPGGLPDGPITVRGDGEPGRQARAPRPGHAHQPIVERKLASLTCCAAATASDEPACGLARVTWTGGCWLPRSTSPALRPWASATDRTAGPWLPFE
jgi:hypothetical protein